MSIPNTKNVTILLYREYSCGNFLANVLCHNKNFIPKIPPKYNLEIDDYFDIDVKHKIIMDTIPTGKADAVNWRNYELGDKAFYKFYLGELFDNDKEQKFSYRSIIHTKIAITNMPCNIIELLKRNGKLFIVAHEIFHLQASKIIFPEAKVVQLINENEIRNLSINLKISKPLPNYLLNSKELPNVEAAYQFDIGTLFDKTVFFREVNKLLNSYDIEDRTLDPRVNEYYEKYVALYV